MVRRWLRGWSGLMIAALCAAMVPAHPTRAAGQEGADTALSQWALAEINAPAAWAAAATILGDKAPAQVVVAVIDTGVDAAHPALQNRLLPGYNAVDAAKDTADVSDVSATGHGTAVAGLIGGVTREVRQAISPAALSPVKVLPIRALGSDSSASPEEVARAIRWAMAWKGPNGEQVRVINLSLGERSAKAPTALAEAVSAAVKQGILVVAAAGNLGDDVGKFYPAALPGVLSVGASRQDHTLQPTSDVGALVVAPGAGLLSTLPGGRYGQVSGTSFAAPVVSAAAAVLWSVYPDRTRAEIQAALIHGQATYPCGDGDADTCQVLDLDLAVAELADK